MAEWWSIEVRGEPSAVRWKATYSPSLIQSANSTGAVDWAWHEYRWGVVFEAAFDDQAQWEAFRALPSVQAALDAAPDPINGPLVHRSDRRSQPPSPQRPTPLAVGVALPEPPSPKPASPPVATPPGPISGWEALRGSLLAFLVIMAIILLAMGFVVVFVLAPFLGF
jgi:hypothetical protein